MINNIDFGSGIIKKYIDFNINEEQPLHKQIYVLKEDLIQIIYENNYLIDVGWYPEFSEKGNFIVSLIKDYKWDNPVLQKICRDLDLLEKYINELIDIVH